VVNFFIGKIAMQAVHEHSHLANANKPTPAFNRLPEQNSEPSSVGGHNRRPSAGAEV
jgi:hypothetical protein